MTHVAVDNTRRGRPHLNEDERDRCMLVLALKGGHSVQAAEALAKEGIQVSDRYLRILRDTDRYLEIRKTQAAEIEASTVEHYKEATRLSLELHRQATLEAMAQLEAGELKDPAKAAQNAMVSAGIATDKALTYEGRPTQIHSTDDMQGLMQRMARFITSIDSTATEIRQDHGPLIPEGADSNA